MSIYCYGCGLSTCIKRFSDLIWSSYSGSAREGVRTMYSGM